MEKKQLESLQRLFGQVTSSINAAELSHQNLAIEIRNLEQKLTDVETNLLETAKRIVVLKEREERLEGEKGFLLDTVDGCRSSRFFTLNSHIQKNKSLLVLDYKTRFRHKLKRFGLLDKYQKLVSSEQNWIHLFISVKHFRKSCYLPESPVVCSEKTPFLERLLEEAEELFCALRIALGV